jgi:hypothetical protein
MEYKNKTVNAILFRKNMFSEKETDKIIKDLRVKPIEKITSSKNYYTYRIGIYNPKYEYRLKEIEPGIQLYF